MSEKINRSILPIPDKSYTGSTYYDAKDPDTKFAPIKPLRPPEGAPNVIIVLLDDVGFGGWGIYAKEGKLAYVYNYLGLKTFGFISESAVLKEGVRQIRLEFKYDGGGIGRGENVSTFVDGKIVLEGRVDHTHATVFSADSTTMIGDKIGAPICEDLAVGNNKFSGRVKWVEINLGTEKFDHMISQEEKMRIAMSIQ